MYPFLVSGGGFDWFVFAPKLSSVNSVSSENSSIISSLDADPVLASLPFLVRFLNFSRSTRVGLDGGGYFRRWLIQK